MLVRDFDVRPVDLVHLLLFEVIWVIGQLRALAGAFFIA